MTFSDMLTSDGLYPGTLMVLMPHIQHTAKTLRNICCAHILHTYYPLNSQPTCLVHKLKAIITCRHSLILFPQLGRMYNAQGCHLTHCWKKYTVMDPGCPIHFELYATHCSYPTETSALPENVN